MHVHVAVHSSLLRAGRRAAEVDPTMGTVELEVQRPSVRTEGLAMTAPAVVEPVRTGADPLFFLHNFNIG